MFIMVPLFLIFISIIRKSKEETPLSSGFGTPLTLYLKNGKVVGCISGYVNKEKLETKLKSVGMMK